uniref:Uncharacterized protein n=1 Tax=Anguilla anguilla TaxID=7936 RepID=A0A0E9S3G8_ANGAN
MYLVPVLGHQATTGFDSTHLNLSSLSL